MDDQELLESHRIFSAVDLTVLMKWMKQLLFSMYWVEPLFDANASFHESLSASGGSVPQLRNFAVKIQLLTGKHYFESYIFFLQNEMGWLLIVLCF